MKLSEKYLTDDTFKSHKKQGLTFFLENIISENP